MWHCLLNLWCDKTVFEFSAYQLYQMLNLAYVTLLLHLKIYKIVFDAPQKPMNYQLIYYIGWYMEINYLLYINFYSYTLFYVNISLSILQSFFSFFYSTKRLCMCITRDSLPHPAENFDHAPLCHPVMKTLKIDTMCLVGLNEKIMFSGIPICTLLELSYYQTTKLLGL